MIEKLKELWDIYVRRYRNVVWIRNGKDAIFINRFEQLGGKDVVNNKAANNFYEQKMVEMTITVKRSLLASMWRSAIYSSKGIYNYIQKEPSYDTCMRG